MNTFLSKVVENLQIEGYSTDDFSVDMEVEIFLISLLNLMVVQVIK